VSAWLAYAPLLPIEAGGRPAAGIENSPRFVGAARTREPGGPCCRCGAALDCRHVSSVLEGAVLEGADELAAATIRLHLGEGEIGQLTDRARKKNFWALSGGNHMEAHGGSYIHISSPAVFRHRSAD
jgi:hypothetical protein